MRSFAMVRSSSTELASRSCCRPARAAHRRRLDAVVGDVHHLQALQGPHAAADTAAERQSAGPCANAAGAAALQAPHAAAACRVQPPPAAPQRHIRLAVSKTVAQRHARQVQGEALHAKGWDAVHIRQCMCRCAAILLHRLLLPPATRPRHAAQHGHHAACVHHAFPTRLALVDRDCPRAAQRHLHAAAHAHACQLGRKGDGTQRQLAPVEEPHHGYLRGQAAPPAGGKDTRTAAQLGSFIQIGSRSPHDAHGSLQCTRGPQSRPHLETICTWRAARSRRAPAAPRCSSASSPRPRSWRLASAISCCSCRHSAGGRQQQGAGWGAGGAYAGATRETGSHCMAGSSWRTLQH